MKVKELIEKLSYLNQDFEVGVEDGDRREVYRLNEIAYKNNCIYFICGYDDDEDLLFGCRDDDENLLF